MDFELTVIDTATDAEIKVSITILDDEVALLKDYLAYCDDLKNTKFLQRGDWGHLGLSQKQGQDLAIDHRLPDPDETAAFISRLRPMILQNEPTYFHKVRGLVGKLVDNEMVRNSLALQKTLFSSRDSQLQIRANGVLVNSEEVLFDFLNAFEYHRVKDKQEFIKSLAGPMPMEMFKFIFLMVLQDKTRAIFELAAMVSVVLGKQEEFDFRSFRNE